MGNRYRGMGVGEAALKGAVASLVGGMAMKLAWDVAQRALVPPERQLTSPTSEVVRRTAEKRGLVLSEAQTKAAAAGIYGGAMATWGALFGVVQSGLHPPGALHGLLLGGLVYTANYSPVGSLTKQGIVPAPGEQSTNEALVPLVPHAVYGLVTAAVFDALS